MTPEILALQQQIDQLNAQMLAAADAANVAVGQASVAKDAATKAKADLDAATAEAEKAKKEAETVAADMYMQGPMSLSQATLLSANGPQDFIDKVVMTDQVSDYQVAHINAMLAAQAKQKDASAAADAASAAADQKAAEAQQISSDAQTKLATAQAQMDTLKSQAAAAGFQQTPNSPDPTGPSTATTTVTGQVVGQWAVPASGTLTSCFCSRWGTFHNGIDIANAIGTPIFAAGDGVVMRAGTATGFGLAVYIQHANGDISVYGHVNQYYVQAGQVVKAGQHIADIGNRGFSTGPHLHFEIEKGMYGTRVDPIPWLAQRGINLG